MDETMGRRQIIYWRMLAAMFGQQEQAPNLEKLAHETVAELGMPGLLLRPDISTDNFLQRFPEYFDEMDLKLGEPGEPLRRAVIASHLLLNSFGPFTQLETVTAAQYSQWLRTVEFLERALGYEKGSLRGQGPGASVSPEHGRAMPPPEICLATRELEQSLIDRMRLAELLQDRQLARQLTPSIGLVEQLLRQKGNISGVALEEAKRLIRTYVAELAEILRLEIQRAPAGKIDRSVPPRRTARNLDVKRTVWRNLPNYDPESRKLLVDQLYFKPHGRKKLPMDLIVVADQSGSMVNAMVHCTILASIFASLPHVTAHLIAFDTRILDLTPHIHDPFEVLIRTELGGGTMINNALQFAREKIREPRRTALVLITDFYEGGSDQELLGTINSLVQSGVHFFPVGAVTSSGYFSVNQWFRTKLKEMGRPILTGTPQKLIRDLKQFIVI